MAKKTQQGDNQMTGHRRRLVFIGLGITLLLAVLELAGSFKILELKTLDWRFKARGRRTPTVNAVIVAIDDESFNGWVDEKNQYQTMPERWIWPRSFWGQAIDNLAKAGAKLVVFDLVFSESSRAQPKQDVDFAAAAARAGNVIFAERHVKKDEGQWKTETIITKLDRVKLDKGHATPTFGADGYIRGYRPVYPNSAGEPDPEKLSIDLAAYRQLQFGKAAPIEYVPGQHGLKVGQGSSAQFLPLDSEWSIKINYLGDNESFPTYPFHHVYYETMDMSAFKDKVVFIGSTSEILHDNFFTPFNRGGIKMPGVETHAHMLDTLMSGQFLRETPGWVSLLILLGLGVLTSMTTFRGKAIYGMSIMAVLLTTYITVAFVVFMQTRLILPMASPALAIVVSFAGIAVYRGVVEERRARTTRAMFSRYVSKQIVDEILKDPSKIKMGGELKEVSILFSDVRGFTAMSERLSAPEVVDVLNEYLTRMVDVVIANGGTLDKYVGDAIMAVWGSPLPDPDHRAKAARTAVQMMEQLALLQEKWGQEGKPKLDIGIGINSGVVVAGNMGHPDFKMDYTVIGDDVNLAARLESANKELRAHVLISGTTLEGCKDIVEIVRHPDIKVKGKEKAVEVYEVVGWKGQGKAPWAVPLPH